MTGKITRFLAIASVFGLTPALAQAQGTTVSGQVTGAGGGPVVGASVSIPTLRVGAFTDDQGRYTFSVPASANGTTVTVTARRLGYQPSSAQVTLSGAPVSQNFSLSSSATEIQGVVVTALGQTREKSRLGTAQTQLSTQDINTTRAQNVVQQIEGKVSGVQVTSSGTQGGSTNIIIRGQNSITGNNQPLFIVDGVPVSNANRGGAPFVSSNTNFDYGNALNDINPDDIESLSVLKGPNAAAIYGSRAANGVILITTRKGGNTNGRLRAEINSNLTWEGLPTLPDFQNLYGQGSGGEFEWADGNYGGINDGVDESWGPRLDGRLICQFTSPGAGTSFIDTNGDFQLGGCTPTPWVAHPDNVKSFFNTGLTATTTVGFSGGTDRLSGRLSAGADNIRG
ncbi:MAG TPA: TonB-dependent receptor plug domain-containing protein, partial [Gemmatimonadaceae bacterium]|nr:TonB-dependent receptor plug domain-containing protein [Gemmatimonadaceae bacterium]